MGSARRTRKQMISGLTDTRKALLEFATILTKDEEHGEVIAVFAAGIVKMVGSEERGLTVAALAVALANLCKQHAEEISTQDERNGS